MHASPLPRVGPLLKWAGGKRQLLATLSQHYPVRFERYFEPFFGSGAVFFDLWSLGRLTGRRVSLSDFNPDLIGCYRTVRDQPDAVIAHLRSLEHEHRERGDVCYYEVRDQRFNRQRAALGESGANLADAYTPPLAAMLIYLNRTGFNGLFRLNRRGGFNVPAGRYLHPRICDPDQVRGVSDTFRTLGLTLAHRSFADAIDEAGAGDFVYCDPPYEPLSPTASFATYTAGGFTMFDQRRLQQAVIGASRRGAFVVISNSSASSILDTYGSAPAVSARLTIRRVPARRAINSRASARGVVDELIISNVRADLAAVRPRMARAVARTRRRSA